MTMKYLWLPVVLLVFGCAKVLPVRQVPPVTLGEAAFFPTIEAHTDAAITSGNLIDILLNGDQTFPVMLRDIQGLSTEEASTRLHVKDQTLKSRLHRVRLLLRERLKAFTRGVNLHHPTPAYS